jgi:hypothetical protein
MYRRRFVSAGTSIISIGYGLSSKDKVIKVQMIIEEDIYLQPTHLLPDRTAGLLSYFSKPVRLSTNFYTFDFEKSGPEKSNFIFAYILKH